MDVLPRAPAQQQIRSLFLLYLFIARTFGDCPKPTLEENIILSDAALVLNYYPDNVEISLTCANGYVQDSGSATIKCIDGAWSDLDLICKKKDCGPPPEQPHMIIDTSKGTLFGAVATVKCEKGFTVKGPAYKQCYNNGWTGKKTKCQIVTCDIPEEITNGMHSWSSTERPQYGESITYSCDKGYRPTGNTTIMCSEEGEFDSAPPQCLGVTKADVFTTPTSTTAPPTQDLSLQTSASTTSAGTTSSGTRDSSHTTRAYSTVCLFTQGGDILRDADNTTTTIKSTIPNYSQGHQNDDIVDTKKDVGYTPVIISVVCVSLAACIAILFIHKLLNKRKGSYDTREDLKPELLQFQNL